MSSDIGPQRGPSSPAKIEAERKATERRLAEVGADPLVTGEPDAMETVVTRPQQRSLSDRIAEQVKANRVAVETSQQDKARTLLDHFAYSYHEVNGHFPLLMHEECYEFMRERCKIVEANIYDEIKNAEVVIETGDMQRHELEFSRLSWSLGRVLGRIVMDGKLLLF